MPWSGPHTIKRGPLAGTHFETQQSYQNALARERGFKNYAAAREHPRETVQQVIDKGGTVPPSQRLTPRIGIEPVVGHWEQWIDAKGANQGRKWTPPGLNYDQHTNTLSLRQWENLRPPPGTTDFAIVFWRVYDGRWVRSFSGYVGIDEWTERDEVIENRSISLIIRVYFAIP